MGTGVKHSGSYNSDDVTFMFKWLSPTERDLAMSSLPGLKDSHYAENLPVEPPPDPIVERIFLSSLDRESDRTAQAVASVAAALSSLKPSPTLVSLARGGIPAGILLKRSLNAYGLHVPHYTVGMLRGIGLDVNAMQAICSRHGSDSLVFVDGWIGKGATLEELRSSAKKLGLPDRLAALADPSGLADFSGSYDDFLVPHALLNNTVSGLVSRPLKRSDVIGEHDYFGADYCPAYSYCDVSRLYVDKISAHFPPRFRRGSWSKSGTHPPAGAGLQAILKAAADHSNFKAELIKAGLSESCRALVRNRATKILLAPGVSPLVVPELYTLANWRNVPLIRFSTTPFTCMAVVAVPTW